MYQNSSVSFCSWQNLSAYNSIINTAFPTKPVSFSQEIFIRQGTDKSLALPGRKQATATKLGIYSTYSPRSSIHFLARCKPLKKKIQKVALPTRSLRQQQPPRWTKNGDFSIVFSIVVRRGRIRRIGWVIKKLEAQVGRFILGCKCPVSRSVVVQEQDRLGDLPRGIFP